METKTNPITKYFDLNEIRFFWSNVVQTFLFSIIEAFYNRKTLLNEYCDWKPKATIEIIHFVGLNYRFDWFYCIDDDGCTLQSTIYNLQFTIHRLLPL